MITLPYAADWHGELAKNVREKNKTYFEGDWHSSLMSRNLGENTDQQVWRAAGTSSLITLLSDEMHSGTN